jgi:lytic murein transglycosylase
MQWRGISAMALALGILCTPAQAAPCGGDFSSWLDTFRREAAGQGIGQRALAALDGVSPSPQVIRLDRNQRAFRLSFEEFVARRVTGQRIKAGLQRLSQHRALLSRIERQYGVQPEIIVAIWGMETDFGANQGKQSVLRALATLAHDCRRSEMFQRELLAALRLIDRGDLTPAEMRGAWAGELGQTQFLPSSYLKFAVDFDGNGRRDLIRSVPDVLASTANYLRGYGWKRGASYAEGGPNFPVLRGWNRASVYQRALAYYAQRLRDGE